MDKTIKFPKFLDIKKLNSINELMKKNTACFLLLSVPTNGFDWPKPINFQEAYIYMVINLYKVYKDYGWHGFYNCLSFDVKKRDDSYTGMYRGILEGVTQRRTHYEFIVDCARHVLAHGICYDVLNDPNFLDTPKSVKLKDFYMEVLGRKDNPNCDEDWEKLTDKICIEADLLYDYIQAWINYVRTTNASIRERVLEEFYFGRYGKGGDYSIERINKDSEYTTNRSNGFEYKRIIDEPSSFASCFSISMIFEHYNMILNVVPPNAMSIEGIGKERWDVNTHGYKAKQNLYYSVAYEVIDSARNILLSQQDYEKTKDIYLLFWNELCNQLMRLPNKNDKSIRSNSLPF